MIPSATAGWDSLAGVWAISVNAYLPSWTWHVGAQAFIDIYKSTVSQCNNLLSNDVSGKMLFLHPSWFEKLCSWEHKHLCHLASTILCLWREDWERYKGPRSHSKAEEIGYRICLCLKAFASHPPQDVQTDDEEFSLPAQPVMLQSMREDYSKWDVVSHIGSSSLHFYREKLLLTGIHH